jgi:hypothetical protein
MSKSNFFAPGLKAWRKGTAVHFTSSSVNPSSRAIP